jgi:hypothetical protein
MTAANEETRFTKSAPVLANYLANAILATVYDNCLPGNKRRISTRQKENCAGDIPRFS